MYRGAGKWREKGDAEAEERLMKELIEKMSLNEFAQLCNRLVAYMGFKIRKSVYRENVVVLDAYMHIPGNALHYVIVFLRKDRVTREELIDIIFSEETVELRWMIITTGYFDDDARALEGDNVTLMDWNDFERLLSKFGLKEELTREQRGEEAREGRYLPSAGEVDSLLQWAEEFFSSENYEKALEYVDRALGIKETHRTKKLKARILLALHREEEAVPLLTSILEENVEDDEAWFILGEILENMGDMEEAERAYQQCTRFNPRNVSCWINRGNIMVQMEKYNEALLCYDKALEIRQELPAIWNNRGVVLKYLGRYDEALQSYNAALKFDPDFADAYLNKAYLYFDKRKYEKAQNEVMEYLKRKNDARGWVLLANIYLKRRRETDAEDALKKALELEPGNMEARELLRKIGRKEISGEMEKEIERLKRDMEKFAEHLDGKKAEELRNYLDNGRLYDAWKILLEHLNEEVVKANREKEMLREALIESLKLLAREKKVRLGNLSRMKNETLIKTLKKISGD